MRLSDILDPQTCASWKPVHKRTKGSYIRDLQLCNCRSISLSLGDLLLIIVNAVLSHVVHQDSTFHGHDRGLWVFQAKIWKTLIKVKKGCTALITWVSNSNGFCTYFATQLDKKNRVVFSSNQKLEEANCDPYAHVFVSYILRVLIGWLD